MLRSLSRMPADMSSDSRRQLLNAVTDLFLLDGDPSEQSRAHYGEIAVQTLPHLESQDKQAYAEHVAAVPSLPHVVATTLASDQNADVARLVLKLSPVLTDSDLAAIAVSQSQSHLVAIAERARLSEQVTDILVTRGDREVLHTVSSNEGANFSDKGFDTLLDRGGQDPEISKALAQRSDLKPERASRVLRIVERLNDGSGENAESVSLARQARQQRLEVKLLIADLDARVRERDDVIIMLADEDRAFHLAQVLAHVGNISAEQALRVLMQREVSGIAVACKSLQVDATAFRAILSLRARRLYFSAQDVDDDMRDYARLDAATADRTMRFLQMKTKLN